MSPSDTAGLEHISVVVAGDRLTACLRHDGGGPAPPPTKDELLNALEEERVALTDAVKARVEEYVALATGDEPVPEEFPVAHGRPAFKGEDEKLVWAGRSETTNPKDLEAFISDYASEVDDELRKSGLLE